MGKRLTKALVTEALHKTKGAVYLAADKLQVSHTTVYNYIRRYPDIADIKDYYDGELVDIGELKLRQQILDGDAWAVKYVLSTKGKSRGSVERQEITGAEGGPVTFKVIEDE